MAYIKTNWVDNQTAITAARMNNIEDGIANNETAIVQVETRIGTLSGIGQPIIASSAEAMTDTEKIYLYVGSEEGYESGHWYYYDTEWKDGGEYGSGATGGITDNARNLLKYILERVAYIETGMQVYVDALYQALAEGGGGGGTTTYMIMNVLSHVTNSNDATGIDDGESYSAILSANTNYFMDTVTITMGGVDVTSTAYDSTDNSISISVVTGDIVITASAIKTLDSIAYGTQTYRDIFITNNSVPIGDLETTLTLDSSWHPSSSSTKRYKANAGSPTQSTEESNSPSHSLKCFASSAQQINYINTTVHPTGNWLACVSVYGVRYTSGNGGGIQGIYLQTGTNSGTLRTTELSSGFNEMVAIIDCGSSTSNNVSVYFGSSGDGDYYVDDVIFTPLPSGMTEAEALVLYKEYIEMRRNA